jgi:hypothetical protein
MALDNTEVYAVRGNRETEQAEASTANRGAGTTQMRILIELQVIAMLLHAGFGSTEDLQQMRQDAADSIT